MSELTRKMLSTAVSTMRLETDRARATEQARCEHGWIETFSGKRFFPLAPVEADISIEDIAHALSNICRFTGHTREFYSVAQHCVLMSIMMEGGSARRLAALLHDASEAYLCDVARPIKPLLQGYDEAERRLQTAIYRRFGIEPSHRTLAEIKHADLRMLATERGVLMGRRNEWPSIHGVRSYPIAIRPWFPNEAKEEFLIHFKELVKIRDRAGRRARS